MVIREKGDLYFHDILKREVRTEFQTRVSVREDIWHRRETDKRIRETLEPYMDTVIHERMDITGRIQKVTVADLLDNIIESALVRGLPYKTDNPEIDKIIEKIADDLRRDRVKKNAEIQEEEADNILDEKLSRPYRPVHLQQDPIPVPPGEVVEYAIAMMPTATIIQKGHRMQLIIRNQDDLLSRLGLWGIKTLPFMRKVTHNIHFGGSHLLLPLIPAK